MLNFINRIKKFWEPEVISNEPNLNEPNSNKQRKVTFRVNAFVSKNMEEIISHSDLSISIFVKAALYDHISWYKELSCEPFELGHWLDDAEVGVSFARYTITLDDTLSNEFNRLESVYSANGLIFNKSHFIRCAIGDRLLNILSEE